MATARASRRFVAVGLPSVLLALVALMATASSEAVDVVSRPPEFEVVQSRSGGFQLELQLSEGANAHAARSTGRLIQVTGAGRQTLWERVLPHRPRPRFAVLGDAGQVVLLDEWLNVRSDLAVMVIDAQGRTVAQVALEGVRAALDVSIGAVASQARHGTWIQAPPVVDASGAAVKVAAANRVLTIRLSDGKLSVR